MSWMSLLYETYENCASQVGKLEPISEQENRQPIALLPIAHTTQEAQLDVLVDMQGRFLSATVIEEKTRRRTIIPCTEESAGRTSSRVPHPLFDTLEYTAGDYERYGGSKKPCFDAYIRQLGQWCDSPYSSPVVEAVYAYLKKGCMVADLVAQGIMKLGENGLVAKKLNLPKEQKPALYRVLSTDVMDAFVRFRVVCEKDQPAVALYEDDGVRKCYTDWYLSLQNDRQLCYVQGKWIPVASNHPSKIRNTADKAKLISFNDTSGFTFRGRFETAQQTVSVGYETTQKAHNALKWLIDRQGYRNGGQVYVAWGTKGEEVPEIMQDGASAFLNHKPAQIFTQRAFAEHLREQMRGEDYQQLDREAKVAILGLDSATPGRLSITYFRQMNGTELLDQLAFWHSTCTWKHTYYRDYENEVKGEAKYLHGVFAPAPRDIVKAAYGEKVSDKLMSFAERQLVPCILEGAPVPISLVKNLFYRAVSPITMEPWEYRKVLTIACAVIRKSLNDRHNRRNGTLRLQEYEEVWKMALQLENRDRSYLFGRVWAYLNYLELSALTTKERYTTNAMKLEERFTKHPASTTMTLRAKLTPYLQSRNRNNENRMKGFYEVLSLLDEKDEAGNQKYSDEPLDYPFIFGMASQMNAFNQKTEENEENQEETEEEMK